MTGPLRLTAAGVDNTARRTWNKEEYAKKAKEREEKVISQR
jgi:hypothetical protein